jgi:GNAT superfamily N-acetyltransferase
MSTGSAGFRIERTIHPTTDQIERIREGLTRFNRAQIPDKGFVPLAFTLFDEKDEFCGGLTGHIAYEWLFVDILWVADHARSRGQGSQLMLAAEEEARSRGCRHAWVDTFSFQALSFYQKLGYTVFGKLDDFPTGYSRYFLRKDL